MIPSTTPGTLDRVAASASAAGAHACADAVEAAVAGVGADAGLVLVFTAGDVDPAAASAEALAAAGGARVAGMTGTGAIGPDGPIRSGCSAIAFSSSLGTGVGAAPGGDPRTAGREAAAEALAGAGDAPHRVLLLFVDSECGDQAEIVAGAYAVAGGRIPLAGGAAGGDVRAQLVDGHALSGGVVAVAVGAEVPIGVGIAHGCSPRGAPAIVTRSSGRAVLQLDGRPAQDVYFEKLGHDGELDDDAFEALAMAHPLAQPELSGALRPRYVRGRHRDGGLVCATAIEPNAPVQICDQTVDGILRSAHAAADDALAQLEGPPQAALVFDCAGRGSWFGAGLAAHEFESLLEAFDAPPALAGAYTRGEIGRVRGAKGDRNHSVVVVAFGPAG